MSQLRPLQLQQALQPLDRRLDLVPLLDMLLLALTIVMLGSPFVMAPGLSVDIEGGFQLPSSSQSRLRGLPVVEVLTVRHAESLFYQGRPYTLEELESMAPGTLLQPREGSILLVRAHRRVTLDTLFRVADWARREGYANIQLAATRDAPHNAFGVED